MKQLKHQLELRFVVSRAEAVQARIKLEASRASEVETYEAQQEAWDVYRSAYETYKAADNEWFEWQVKNNVG